MVGLEEVFELQTDVCVVVMEAKRDRNVSYMISRRDIDCTGGVLGQRTGHAIVALVMLRTYCRAALLACERQARAVCLRWLGGADSSEV